MSKRRFRSALIAAVCVAAPANAAPVLLAEIAYNQPDPIQLPAAYVFRVLQGQSAAGFSRVLAAWPYVEVADDDVVPDHPSVADFNRVLCIVNDIPIVEFRNDLQSVPFMRMSFDAIWYPDLDPNDGFTAVAHVPRIHPPGRLEPNNGLVGYWLRRVEWEITAAGQTTRFYGIVIPEPATWIIAVCGVLLHFNTRRHH